MMVGNKADLRQAVTEQGQKCVPINYGEKLAMVRSKYTSLKFLRPFDTNLKPCEKLVSKSNFLVICSNLVIRIHEYFS